MPIVADMVVVMAGSVSIVAASMTGCIAATAPLVIIVLVRGVGRPVRRRPVVALAAAAGSSVGAAASPDVAGSAGATASPGATGAGSSAIVAASGAGGGVDASGGAV